MIKSDIKKHFTGGELEAILRMTQMMLSDDRGFRIPERKSGLTVSEIVDLKRKIEKILRIPGTPLIGERLEFKRGRSR